MSQKHSLLYQLRVPPIHFPREDAVCATSPFALLLFIGVFAKSQANEHCQIVTLAHAKVNKHYAELQTAISNEPTSVGFASSQAKS
jgi:hypothetical protein